MLEARYKQLWGTDFTGAFESITSKNIHSGKTILKKAAEDVSDFLWLLEEVGNMGKSPFVVYIKDRNEFKA